MERLLATGTFPLLERLRGRDHSNAMFATVPGLGPKTAARIRAVLGIETLADLELAAHDGRLACLPGIGRKRLRAVRESLAGRFHHPTLNRARSQPVQRPDIAELLSIDEEYRRKAAQGRLLQVAPYRFNPRGTAWLPILRTHRADRRYTALYSNSPRAHELDMTHDWVVIYGMGPSNRGQSTVITSRRGPLKGRRVVRGREAECVEHYARLEESIAAAERDG
jgi:hypothetical protein